MTSRSLDPKQDRVGATVDVLQPEAATPQFCGFLVLVPPPPNAPHEQPHVVSPRSGGASRADFHHLHGQRLWCVFASEPKVGTMVLCHHYDDRKGATQYQLPIIPIAVDSNDAETRYREARGNVIDHRNVRGQFHVRGYLA